MTPPFPAVEELRAHSQQRARPLDGLQRALFHGRHGRAKHPPALIEVPLALVGRPLALGQRGLMPVGLPLPLVGPALPLIGQRLPLVGPALPLIGQRLALVGFDLALIGRLLARSLGLTLIRRRACVPRGRPLAIHTSKDAPPRPGLLAADPPKEPVRVHLDRRAAFALL